jgi:hypothetical protein
VLLKNLAIAEAFSLYSQANHHFELASAKERASSKTIKKHQLRKKPQKIHQMARIRSTARVTRVGEETEATKIAPIFEVMRQ